MRKFFEKYLEDLIAQRAGLKNSILLIDKSEDVSDVLYCLKLVNMQIDFCEKKLK
jgi:hypothetical protein